MAMRVALWLLTLSALGCSPATSGPAHDSTDAAAPAPTQAAAPASPQATPAPPPGASFVYQEDDVTVSFTPPNKVALVGRAKPCAYELSEHGNMYSGKEIEAAWRDAEAQSAVAGSKNFMPPSELSVAAEVRGPNGRIAWTPFCGGLCVAGPKGVTELLRVLHGLAVNARGVCKT